MVGVDYESILRGLKQYIRKPPQDMATTERIQQFAQSMAQKGYKHTPESLAALADWINGYGVLLSGAVGVGKTSFFNSLGDTYSLSMREAFLWEYSEINSWLIATYKRDILIDDVGAEQRSRKFGEPYWMISIILENRLKSPRRTNFTTNFTSQELAEKYADASIVDRIFELAKGHRLERSTSLREPLPRSGAVKDMEQYFAVDADGRK